MVFSSSRVPLVKKEKGGREAMAIVYSFEIYFKGFCAAVWEDIGESIDLCVEIS